MQSPQSRLKLGAIQVLLALGDVESDSLRGQALPGNPRSGGGIALLASEVFVAFAVQGHGSFSTLAAQLSKKFGVRAGPPAEGPPNLAQSPGRASRQRPTHPAHQGVEIFPIKLETLVVVAAFVWNDRSTSSVFPENVDGGS